jgi:hypothetical protein
MKTFNYILVSIAFLLSGCATTDTSKEAITSVKPSLTLSQEKTWKLMIGKWYGSQPTKDGGKKREIMERAPNGTYKITFRVYGKDGKYKEQTEVGHWGVSGPVYFLIFRGWVKGDKFSPANPADPYNYDAYKIVRLTNEIFEYESYSSGNRYIIKRVPQEFEFPE